MTQSVCCVSLFLKYTCIFNCFSEYILINYHRQLDFICGRISKFLDIFQDIRALTEARTGTEPAGEIRGGIHE